MTATTPPPGYVLDPAWHAERDRLDSLTSLYDDRTLRLVGTHAESMQVRADRERGLPQWELLVDQLAPVMLAHGLIEHEELEQFHELWHDGTTICFAPLMVSAWGRGQAR